MPLKMDHQRNAIETAWLGFLEYRNTMFGSDEDPKPKLIVRISFCTAKSDTLCILSIACTLF